MKIPQGIGVPRHSHFRVNEFSPITGIASFPRRPWKQSRIVWWKQKEKPSRLMVWAIVLCMRSFPLPDSILVSVNQGSDLTQDESQKNLDIYFRDSFFLSCNAFFCVFSWTPNKHVWEQKFNDRVHSVPPTAKQHRLKTTADWSGNLNEWKKLH